MCAELGTADHRLGAARQPVTGEADCPAPSLRAMTTSFGCARRRLASRPRTPPGRAGRRSPRSGELPQRYEPLFATSTAGCGTRCASERAEITQEARPALMRAIRVWQANRGPLAGCVAHCVRTRTAAVLSVARAEQHRVSERSGCTGRPYNQVKGGDVDRPLWIAIRRAGEQRRPWGQEDRRAMRLRRARDLPVVCAAAQACVASGRPARSDLRGGSRAYGVDP